MNINSTTSLTTQASTATSISARNVSTLQKMQQDQRQQTLEQAKPVAEQVYISRQAQQQLETYTKSAANAAERYTTGNEPSSSTTSSTDQIMNAVNKQQNRQTAAALATYLQQQAQADRDKPATSPESIKSSQATSIQERA
jgi:hypothetical protein